MNIKHVKKFITLLALAAMLATTTTALAKGPPGDKPGGGKPGTESASNNLSYPVIWAEGVSKVLPGEAGAEPILNGVWWYQWGTNGVDPDVTPASCPPDPDDMSLCDDGVPFKADGPAPGDPPADNPLPLAKAYLQKDTNNVWQAGSWPFPLTRPSGMINVDLIDWGDNLESVDWYTRSQVRTEIVLFEDQTAGPADDVEEYPWPMLEYQMRHTSGWGINEVHGLAAEPEGVPVPMYGPGTRATVYSHCARFTIQRLLVERESALLSDLLWVPGEGWTEPAGSTTDLINPPIFNGSVHEGGDGPGYYSAEINVKGRIIYGYTWNVRKNNEGAGDYRLTFSLDATCGATTLNTNLNNAEILEPVEEVIIEAESTEGGGAAVIDSGNNLTYINIRILERNGGGGGGPRNDAAPLQLRACDCECDCECECVYECTPEENSDCLCQCAEQNPDCECECLAGCDLGQASAAAEDGTIFLPIVAR